MLPATYSEGSTAKEQHEPCRMHCWMLDCDLLAIMKQGDYRSRLTKLNNACARAPIVKYWMPTFTRVYQAKVVHVNHAVLCFDAEETEK